LKVAQRGGNRRQRNTQRPGRRRDFEQSVERRRGHRTRVVGLHHRQLHDINLSLHGVEGVPRKCAVEDVERGFVVTFINGREGEVEQVESGLLRAHETNFGRLLCATHAKYTENSGFRRYVRRRVGGVGRGGKSMLEKNHETRYRTYESVLRKPATKQKETTQRDVELE